MVADLVGAGEVALTFGQRALGHEGVDCLVRKSVEGEDGRGDLIEPVGFASPGEGAAGGVGVRVGKDVEDCVKSREDLEDGRPVVGEKAGLI